MMSTKNEKNMPTIFNNEKNYYKQDWQDYYPALIRLIPDNSHILDIGCGRGGLLEYLRNKKNCSVIGLDISDDATTICNKKNIDVIRCDLENNDITGTYDIIIFSAVLEHLIDPLSVLYKVRDNLNKNGYIIVGVPNFSELTSRIQYLLGKNVKVFDETNNGKRIGIQPYGHIQFFNKASLSYILDKTGYKSIEWSYYRSIDSESKTLFHKLQLARIFSKIHKIDPELFSSFIIVKAVKK